MQNVRLQSTQSYKTLHLRAWALELNRPFELCDLEQVTKYL